MSRHVLLVTSGVGPVEARCLVARVRTRLEELLAALGVLIESTVVEGDDDAPRSVALAIALPAEVPKALADECGTHALVARSAARGQRARKRWFVAVSLHASAPRARDVICLRDADLEVRACRAGGPGGQHVNKVSSAVRVLHVPSGLTVHVASERSQRANLGHAKARLDEMLAQQRDDHAAVEASSRRRAHYTVVRGAPVRTYRSSPTRSGDLVLHE